ncbi:unnamed protein product [Rodentolepis nana]|uniref:Rab-GAP TBC domain-containing protein n=1 Tax=Rodentolepis nana TaxID=102285 RepID=A0A158QI41_RODNA|nr:unnamed protein product [Rodentolepis nana]
MLASVERVILYYEERRDFIYEVEEPKMTGPSNLLHALKEVKYAEKEQLGSAPHTELRRITLFDLINEKERRHKLRSPPPIPPKPLGRNVSFTDRSPSEKKSENSAPRTIEALKSMSLKQTPPSLPKSLKSASPKNTVDVSADISKNTQGVVNTEKESTPPISQNPFVQWDRLRTQPLLKSNSQVISSFHNSFSFQEDLSVSRPEGKSASPCSSGVGTDGFDEDGPVTISSTNSANTLDSSSSPDWPKPEKITARPKSQKCSPDTLDKRKSPCDVPKETVDGAEFFVVDLSPVRVSLIAAPKTDVLNFETKLVETASNASNSSRASTVFSYPWDLPPPQSDHSSSSSTTPPCHLKWAALQHHLTEYENKSDRRDSTLKATSVETRNSEGNGVDTKQCKNGLFKLPTVLLNEMDIHPFEKADPDKTSSGDEQFFEIAEVKPTTLDDGYSYRTEKEYLSPKPQRNEEPYDTIRDDILPCDRISEGSSAKVVPSPNVDTSTPTSTESSQNKSSQQYVYAEIKLSSDTSTLSSLAFHTPPVPTHPSKSKAKAISPELQVYDEIENKNEQIKFKDLSFNVPSSTPIPSALIDHPNASLERRRLESQLFEPVKRIFAQLCRSFRPTDKLNHLVNIFQCIDSQVSLSLSSSDHLKDSSDPAKLTLYAIVFALTDLLKPSKRLYDKIRNQIAEGNTSDISRIEVHRLYLEALISPACLASSAEGCRRLTELICLLRYIDNFKRYGSPADEIRILCLRRIHSTELEEIPWSPNLYKLRRSFTDNIQEALQRSTHQTLTTGSFSPPSLKKSTRKICDRDGSIKTTSSISISGSSFIVLAAMESKKTLVPFEVPLRSSMTVRELCNMLALKLAQARTCYNITQIRTFYHNMQVLLDIPMSDNLHLESFLTQNYGEECGFSVSSLASIESFCENSSQPSTPKMSNIRRIFRRRKRIASSDSALRWLESPKPSRRCFIEGQDEERRPSVDWSSLGRKNPHFVLIYRRRSYDVVLYANDLFECLPSAGKLI